MTIEKITETNKIIKELKNDLSVIEDRNVYRAYKKAISNHYLILAEIYRENGIQSEYRQTIAKAIKFRKTHP